MDIRIGATSLIMKHARTFFLVKGCFDSGKANAKKIMATLKSIFLHHNLNHVAIVMYTHKTEKELVIGKKLHHHPLTTTLRQ